MQVSLWPADFADQFWRAYPRRVAKRAALKALDRVRRSGEVTFPVLIAAVERYAESVVGKDLQFVAHASTWLNQGRWEDDPAHLGNSNYGPRKISNAEGWFNRSRDQKPPSMFAFLAQRRADLQAEIDADERGDLERQAGSHRPLRLISNP